METDDKTTGTLSTSDPNILRWSFDQLHKYGEDQTRTLPETKRSMNEHSTVLPRLQTYSYSCLYPNSSLHLRP